MVGGGEVNKSVMPSNERSPMDNIITPHILFIPPDGYFNCSGSF
jgi:hypothetical protein